MFNFPQDIFVMDSLLIVHDSDGMDKAFDIFHKLTGNHILDFGLRGRGPGETLDVSSVNLMNDTLYVYDANLKKLVLYDIRGILAGKNSRSEISTKNAAPNMILQAVPTGNGEMILCGNDNRMRFGLWNMSLNEIKTTINDYPPYTEDKETDCSISCYSASIGFCPSENKLVSATYIGATMEIYNISYYGFDKTFSGYYYRPVYEYARGAIPRWVIPGQDTIIGFQDLCLTNSAIYGLIWGIESPSEDNLQKLIKFDYNGTPLCRYELPDILESMTVDEDGNIYGMAMNENMEFNIRKYCYLLGDDNLSN